MAQNETLRIKGYREFLRACQQAPKDTKKFVRAAFRAVGEIIRADAAGRFSSVDPRSASKYRVRVRQRGIAVEQSLRRTTGLHPEYAGLQMRRALLPALVGNVDTVERATEDALDKVIYHFERTSQP